MLRLVLTAMLGALLVFPAHAQKAGVGAWEDAEYSIVNWIEDVPALGWYYTWRPDQIWSAEPRRRSVEFVPMIHSERDLDRAIVSDTRVAALLGFNEPDGRGEHQAGLSVERAVELWPRLEAFGLRLGSPATTRDGTLGPASWMRRFMDQADRRGLRIDFVAVHYYTETGDVDEFRDWLELVHEEYRRPIWVTEYAYVDWAQPARISFEKNAEFMAKAVPMLESLSFVERHAWFAALPYPWEDGQPQTNLLDDALRPTVVGDTFERLLSDVAATGVADLGS